MLCLGPGGVRSVAALYHRLVMIMESPDGIVKGFPQVFRGVACRKEQCYDRFLGYWPGLFNQFPSGTSLLSLCSAMLCPSIDEYLSFWES